MITRYCFLKTVGSTYFELNSKIISLKTMAVLLEKQILSAFLYEAESSV